MFIRFITYEIDEDSHVEAGVFMAAGKLRDEGNLPEYELNHLKDLLAWFHDNLESPYEYRVSRPKRKKKSICWFKSLAKEHLEKMREIIIVLENHDVHIRMIKTEKIGYVLYEDEHQVFAEPFADMNLQKRR